MYQEGEFVEQVIGGFAVAGRQLSAEALVKQDVLVDDARHRFTTVVLAGQQGNRRFGHADLEAGEVATLVVGVVLRHQFAIGTGECEFVAQSLDRTAKVGSAEPGVLSRRGFVQRREQETIDREPGLSELMRHVLLSNGHQATSLGQ
jgi:hypothetical protein